MKKAADNRTLNRKYGIRTRKSEKHKGIAIVRDAIGYSQERFAKVVGTTKATVENIELGRAPLRDNLAEAIGAFTGAVPWTLSSAAGPKDFSGKPYTARSWEKWQKYEFPEADLARLQRKSCDALAILLTTAAQRSDGRPSSHIFRSIVMAFNRFVFDQIKNHHLESRVETLMEGLAKSDVKRTTIKAARAALTAAPGWRNNDRKEWLDSTRIGYKVRCVPQFVPFFGFGRLDGTPVFYNDHTRVREIFDFKIKGKRFRAVRDKVKMNAMFSSKSPLYQTLTDGHESEIP
jgi:transcriptional regulator with XRE-family HTH domain